MRRMALQLGVVLAMTLAAGTTRADSDHRRVTITVSTPYMIVPLYVLGAELAVDDEWSVAIRGGGGVSDLGGVDRTIVEVGGQGVYYMNANPGRGLQLGLDTRYVSYEGDGLLAGLGDGVAVGPFVGYKRTFGPGFTLVGQLGAQVVVSGDSEDPVLPYVNLALGWSFWPSGNAATATDTEVVAATKQDALTSPLDYHKGLMIGFSIGGGSASLEGCDACDLQPGIALDASVGWFVHRRVAVMLDSTATVSVFSPSSGFGSFGTGLSSVAVQYWPHEDVWLKVGVGVAQLTSVSFGGTGMSQETGGGGTLAVGYEFHHDRNFGMDLQLRATHGSFEPENERFEGADAIVGLVGFNWY